MTEDGQMYTFAAQPCRKPAMIIRMFTFYPNHSVMSRENPAFAPGAGVSFARFP